MLPNFFCIGAQKSGTTTIWQILDAHKDICMAQPRETRFFYDDLLYEEGLQKYEIHNFGHWNGQKRVGEKCPEYLSKLICASRIRQNLGSELQFIISLRSPAQRAFAQYRHNMAALRECRPFATVLADEAALLGKGIAGKQVSGYLERGFYASQIKEYLKHFPPRNFLFLKFESIFDNDQRDLAAQIYRFLDVPVALPNGLPFKSGRPGLDQIIIQHNVGQSFVEITAGEKGGGMLKKWLNCNSKKVTVVRNPSPQLIKFSTCFNANKPNFTHLDKATECELNIKYFNDEILALKDLVPFDTDSWLA